MKSNFWVFVALHFMCSVVILQLKYWRLAQGMLMLVLKDRAILTLVARWQFIESELAAHHSIRGV
ncbi:MAG: hypothetical protein CMK28_00475 [Porticoccaceae bacterium]|nr:hypothetical protein [Porticoccaceae bacterium]